MCYASSQDFGWRARKETGRRPEADTPTETPEKPVKAQDFTFLAFPKWHRTPPTRTHSAEGTKERV